jgi:hypothetical protein
MYMLTLILVPHCVDLNYVKQQQVPKYTSQNVVAMVSTAIFILVKKYIFNSITSILWASSNLS